MSAANEPPIDSPLTVALDAATAQFTRMPTSNPWDYAHAIVRALHTAGLLKADLDVALRTLDVVTKERDAMKPIVAKYRKIQAIVDALPGEAADG